MTDKMKNKTIVPAKYPKEWLMSEEERDELKRAEKDVVQKIQDVLKNSDRKKV